MKMKVLRQDSVDSVVPISAITYNLLLSFCQTRLPSPGACT